MTGSGRCVEGGVVLSQERRGDEDRERGVGVLEGVIEKAVVSRVEGRCVDEEGM